MQAPAGRRVLVLGAIAAGYLGLCLAYVVWVWSDDIGELGGDSAMYVLLARQFSPFFAASAVLAQATQGTIYPPLFPFLIGLLGGSMVAAHLLVAACLLAAVACLYHWLRIEGLGPLLGAWAAAVFALMPGTYFLGLSIWTENPYLLLSLLAILAERRASASEQPRPAFYWLAAAAVAAATLTRAAALPLLAAFILRLLLLRPRHWLSLLAASAAPFLAWAAWSRLHQAGVSGYVAQWMSTYGEHPGAALAAQLSTELHKLRWSWLQAWLGHAGTGSPLAWLLLAFGALCLLACMQRLARLQFDAIYATLYLALLLSWPFPAEASRLGYVILPILLTQALLFTRTILSQRRELARPVTALLLGVLTLMLLPTLALTVQRFDAPLPAELATARRTEPYYAADPRQSMQEAHAYAGTLEVLRGIGQWVPEGDCIFSIKPSVVVLYAHRPSLLPPPSAASEAEFKAGIGKCRFAYALAAISPSFGQTLYPLDRLGSRARVLQPVSESDGAITTIFAELLAIDGDGAGT